VRHNKLKAQIGYKPHYDKGGKTASITDIILNMNFNPDMSNTFWVVILHTLEYTKGFMCCDSDIFIFTSHFVGWSMNKFIDR